MAGRRPKPAEIKELQGTSRPDRDNKAAPKFTGKPKMPPVVERNKEARLEWERITRELAALDLLKATDQAMLTGYVMQWSLWLGALDIMEKEGQTVKEPIVAKDGEIKGYKTKRHPASVVASDALKNLRGIAATFGFDPSARTRVYAGADAAENADEVEAHLAGDDDDDGAPISNPYEVN